MSKFGNLSGSADEPFRVFLIDVKTDLPLKDTDGKEAFIDVMSMQSEAGRGFDKEQRTQFQRRAMSGRNQQIVDDDPFEQNVAKLARLTKGWHLVDPVTRQPLDVPLSVEAAAEFYILPLAHPFYMQVFMAANAPANFIGRSSKT